MELKAKKVCNYKNSILLQPLFCYSTNLIKVKMVERIVITYNMSKMVFTGQAGLC